MESTGPSGTALSAALLRAAHLLFDEEPKVFVDELAMPLCGFHDVSALRTTLTALQDEAERIVGTAHAAAALRAVRTAVLVRSRYTEEVVEASLHDGISQYVVLGAGLDSFAYRRRDLADRLRVFEVDHPATQQWKRARLQAMSIPLPSHLTFLPIDFERQALMDALQEGGYQHDERAVFSCLGVSQYLRAEAIQETLAQLASAAPGSRIIFGYLVPETLLDEDNCRVRALLNTLTAARGEPILTEFTPAGLRAQLEAMGFTEVTDLGEDNGLAHYTAERTDGLQHPHTHRVVHARVR